MFRVQALACAQENSLEAELRLKGGMNFNG